MQRRLYSSDDFEQDLAETLHNIDDLLVLCSNNLNEILDPDLNRTRLTDRHCRDLPPMQPTINSYSNISPPRQHSGGSSTTRQSSFGRYDHVKSRVDDHMDEKTMEQTRAHYHNYVKETGSLSRSGNGSRKSINSPYRSNGRIHSNSSSPANSKVIKKEWRSHF